MDRVATWERVGDDVSGYASDVDEILKATGLDYTVETQPLVVRVDEREVLVPGKSVCVDVTNSELLGIVSERYEPVQNRELFEFLNHIDGQVHISRAGITDNGMIFMAAELEPVDVLGDIFTPTIITQNSHNGKHAPKITIVPLRVVCQNQFYALFHDAENSFSINCPDCNRLVERRIDVRHRPNVISMKQLSKEAYVERANAMVAATTRYMERTRQEAEKFAARKLGPRHLENILTECFPTPPDMHELTAKRQLAQRELLRAAYQEEDNENFKGTAWGLINAYADYETHRQPDRESERWTERRFQAITFNPGIMTRFMDLVSAVVDN